MTQTQTLLLIDDEKNILHSLKRLFRKEPFRVITASSGAEALEMMEQEDVAVILSDQRMPEMTGSELLNRIKQTHPNTVRLVMSGYTELESITSAINDGAVFKFLVKPWDDRKLVEQIHEAFSIHEFKVAKERQRESLRQTNLTLGHEVKARREESNAYQQGMMLAQSILEYIPAAVMGLDDAGTVVTANGRARELLAANGLVGLPMEQVLPRELQDTVRKMNSGDMQDYHGTSLALTLDGLTVKFNVSRFKGPGGATGVVVVGCVVSP